MFCTDPDSEIQQKFRRFRIDFDEIFSEYQGFLRIAMLRYTFFFRILKCWQIRLEGGQIINCHELNWIAMNWHWIFQKLATTLRDRRAGTAEVEGKLELQDILQRRGEAEA